MTSRTSDSNRVGSSFSRGTSPLIIRQPRYIPLETTRNQIVDFKNENRHSLAIATDRCVVARYMIGFTCLWRRILDLARIFGASSTRYEISKMSSEASEDVLKGRTFRSALKEWLGMKSRTRWIEVCWTKFIGGTCCFATIMVHDESCCKD